MTDDKPRCNGLWTEARFKSFVTSALRSAFRRWAPKSVVLKAAFVDRRINPKSGRLANHYKCAKCKADFPQSAMQVDHKVPIGAFQSWDIFVDRLFCEADNLQAICKPCHKLKSKKETKKRMKKAK